MNMSFVSRFTRRKVAAVAIGVAATAALAVPGVAWAQNAIPGNSSPVAVATPAAESTPAAQLTPASDVSAIDADGKNCSVSVNPITDEELQKLIDEGKAAGIEMSVATATTESLPADSVVPDDVTIETKDGAVTVTSVNC
ncbi:hypothetical protein ACFTSD_18355 [Nocardiaceae bacterium NPDC056970]